MAAPTFVAVGAQSTGIGSISPAWPTHQANDIGILVVEQSALDIESTPAGWTHVIGSPLVDVASTAGSKMSVLWRRAASSTEAAPTIDDGSNNNHAVARIFVYRGVFAAGDPINAIASAVTAASTSFSYPSVTTTKAECMVLLIASRPNDNSTTTGFGVPTNGALASIAERGEAGTASGEGGGYALADGIKTAAGSTGTSAGTAGTSTTHGLFTIALAPVNDPPVTTLNTANESGFNTATPVLAFSASDAQGESVTYNLQVAQDSGFTVGLIDRVSNTHGGFTNVTTPSDTDPFNSGDTVNYTVQSAEALANGTYYWRVRAIDPSGSNVYGAFSATRSFGVVAAASIRTNLARDPSLESNTLWTFADNVTASTLTATRNSPNVKMSGRSTIRLENTATGQDDFGYYQIPVKGGATYTYSAYCFMEQWDGTASRAILAASVPSFGAVAETNLVSHVNGWQRYSISLTIPAGDTHLELRIYSPKGIVYWDGLLLEETNVLKPYFDPHFPESVWTGAEYNSNAIQNAALTSPVMGFFLPSNIKADRADASGTIVTLGGSTITERGFCYVAGTALPTTADLKVFDTGSFTTGNYSKTLTGMAGNTTYTIRPYVIDSSGTTYGPINSLTTRHAINTIEDLNNIRNITANINGVTRIHGKFSLMRNLDFNDDASYANAANKPTYTTGNGWNPLGRASPDPFFGAELDGQGYTISNLMVNDSTTGQSNSALIGVADECIVENLGLVNPRINANATNSAFNQAGALIMGIDPVKTVIVRNCFAKGGKVVGGDATGNNGTGGLIGIIHEYPSPSSVDITDCYSEGTQVVRNGASPAADNGVGGLIGTVNTASAASDTYISLRVTRCYAASSVSGASTAVSGGLIGIITTSASVNTSATSSYWDTQASGQTTSAGGTGVVGKSTADMKLLSTYAGWDIVTKSTYTTQKWFIEETVDYPRLGYQYVVTAVSVAITKSLAYAVKVSPATTKSLTYRVLTTSAALTKASQYSVRKAVAVTKSLQYAVTKNLAITKSLSYSVLKAYSLTKSLQYAVKLPPISITKSTQYAVKLSASTTKSLQYTVKQAAAVTKGLAYRVTQTPAALTKSLAYAVRPTYALSKSVQYAIKNPAAVTKSLTYRVTTSLAISKSLNYAVLKSTAITKGLRYAVIKPVAVTKSLKYTVLATASALTKSTAYAVKAPLALTKSLKYTVTSTAAALTKSAAYKMRTTLGTTKQLGYAVKTVAALTKSASYTIVRPASLTKSLSYAVKAPANLTKAAQYNVLLASTTIAKQMQYAVRPAFQITKSLAYATRVNAVIGKGLVYTVKSPVAVTKALQYTVKTTAASISKSAQYQVRKANAVTKSLAYQVLLAVAIQRQMKYHVLTQATAQLPMKYAVRPVYVQTKQLAYTVKQGISLTKPLAYTIKASAVITKGIIYRVTAAAVLTKQAQYTVRTSAAAITKAATYSVTAPAALTKSVIYSVKTNVATTKALTYRVKTTTAAITKSVQYTVKAPANITKALAYRVIATASAITKPLAYKVSLAAAVQKSLEYALVLPAGLIGKSLAYSVKTNVAITKPLQYAMRPVVVIGKPVTYSVRVASTISKAVTYTISTNIALTKAAAYDVLVTSAVSVTKTAAYSIKVPVAITKTVTYAVRGSAAIGKSMKYSIRTSVPITKALQYTMLRSSALTKQVAYAVTKPLALTKSVSYAVKSAAVTTKSLTYQVKTSVAAITKSASYQVTTSAAVTKSLAYQLVGAPLIITKGMSYSIATTAALTKSTAYAIATSANITKALDYAVLPTITIAKTAQYAIKRTRGASGALSVNGVGGSAAADFAKVLHTNSVNVGNNDSYFLSGWFVGSTTADMSISEKWGDTGANRYPWAIRINGNLRFAIFDGTNNPGVSWAGTTQADGKLHHFVAVRDHARDLILLYIDGELRSQATDTTTGDVSTDRNIYVGSRSSTFGGFKGSVDEFELYRGVPSAADVASLFAGIKPAHTNLLRLSFNSAVNGVTLDASGNGNHATLGNNATIGAGLIIDELSKAMKYVIKAPAALSKNLQYAVKHTASAITKPANYAVFSSVGIAKQAKYAVKLPSSIITKSLQYAVRGSGSATKSLRYAVISGNTITRSLAYSLRLQGSLTKSVRYAVSAAKIAALPLRYEINVRPTNRRPISLNQSPNVLNLHNEAQPVVIRQYASIIPLEQRSSGDVMQLEQKSNSIMLK